ncbi:MAG: NAD(P)/FAD-dependent oxidoreductase [Candidatus Aureabacteria bacterium]|nr:NAD(P)/FAD-dependent oxidoreductase [Candidatus Auribacterota bacterium]
MSILTDFQQVKPFYDVVVIGSGLGGLTCANKLGSIGYRVLLVEQHHQLGGLAAWFKRGDHIFDVSLHGFPHGMIKTCRKYWNREIADRIIRLKHIRFINPQFQLETTYDRENFTRILVEHFRVDPDTVERFFTTARAMNFYDNHSLKIKELFDRFFPGRNDVARFLLEPITYANGSTLDEPAITYGIVFSNFMNQGVYTFEGGTDLLIRLMTDELLKNKVDILPRFRAEKLLIKQGRIEGVYLSSSRSGKNGGRCLVSCRSVCSNGSLLGTIYHLAGQEHFKEDYLEQAGKVRINNSSCQVYIAIKKDSDIPFIGDLIFYSESGEFTSESLLEMHTKSRTFSVYYPSIRPGRLPRYFIVSSTNANYRDWEGLTPSDYKAEKNTLIENTLLSLEKLIPDIRRRVCHLEAATPKTFERYTLHWQGASFGTKFEGLKVSTDMSFQIAGLFHTGSVGIIMSGWLGAINYGIITSNEMDKLLKKNAS